MSTVRSSMETGSPRPRKIARLSCFGLLLFVAAMLCAASPAKADYRLHVGDVIEISVARAPELKQRVPVQLDGSISFPMMGNLPVAGLTPAEAQSRIQAILATKVFRQRLSDGRDNEIMIDHDEVTATVVLGALASSVTLSVALSIGGVSSKNTRACMAIFVPEAAPGAAATVKLTKPPALLPAA